MRGSTMLKWLLVNNTVILSMENGKISAIITNLYSGNSHMVTATSVSLVYRKAYTDTLKIAIDDELNF